MSLRHETTACTSRSAYRRWLPYRDRGERLMALDAGLGGVSPLAGRVIFGLIMLALVAGHFTDAGTMVEYAPSKGSPSPDSTLSHPG